MIRVQIVRGYIAERIDFDKVVFILDVNDNIKNWSKNSNQPKRPTKGNQTKPHLETNQLNVMNKQISYFEDLHSYL